MELDRVKAKINKISKENNIDVQATWDILFFDEFLERLSKSEYKNRFVLKGGFYLQSIGGINSRSTMDIDLKLIGNGLSNDELYKIFIEICSNNDNSIILKVLGVSDITAETKYGGKTVKIEAKFYNVKKIFGIDIGFGDVITPYPKNYNYYLKIKDSECELLSYPIETCIAEKFETLISKGINNSRSKDLLDIYLYSGQKYDSNILNVSIINTFNLRGTIYEKSHIENVLNNVFNSIRIKELYENYQKKHKFALNICFDDCKNAVYEIFNKLEFKDKIKLNDYAIELHIVRHGQDEKNKLGGWSDNHLIDEGINQVNNLKDEIDDNYDLFISSDLTRCVETSNIINEKLNKDIIYDSNYREVNNGDLKK
ncbi:MAG: nucleotidyl transferase AbiEii/AbiGii toxin family protein [Acholeplasmatales bacterium]|nr:nucleotidyl transferase AbiEii/AbiGii toxin family protein [Acholeplasmatales bacterium]